MNTFSSLFSIMVDATLKATVLLGLAWIAARLLKNRSSASRYLIWTSAVSAALLLPLLSLLLPEWHVKGIPQLPAVTAPKPVFSAPGKALSQVAATTKPRRRRESTASPLVITREQAEVASASPPVDAEPHRPQTSGVDWKQWLGILWASGALVVGYRLWMSRLRLTRLVRRSTPLRERGWSLQAREIARIFGIHRHIALLQSTETEVPLTAGVVHPRIILPADYVEWSAVRRIAVLHHELAHIKRLDTLTQSIADCAVAWYWFHPLVWITALNMRAERERACDDQVLASGAKPSEYAHELLEIASSLQRPTLHAALAMARRSQLEGRLMALLNPRLPRGSLSRKLVLTIAAMTLCVVFPLAAMRAAQQASTPGAKPSPSTPGPASTLGGTPRADQHAATPGAGGQEWPYASTPGADRMEVEPPEPPEPPQPPEPPAAPETPEPAEPALQRAPAVPAVPAVPAAPAVPAVPAAPAAPGADLAVCGTHTQLHNMSIHSDNGHQRWNAYWSGDECSLELRAEGSVQFIADATEIQSISSGGFFEVNQRERDTWKQIKVTPSGNGLLYAYKLNGKEQPFDAQAKAWFSSFILALERSTSLAAESRVKKLLEKGGPTAVLDEINNLHGDYVRSRYFRLLLEQPNLPPTIVVRIINQAGEQMGSDYELARVLMEVAKQYELPDETSRTAFLGAAGKLKSDYEHSRVLIELLQRPNISSENVKLALNSAAGIKSDYEKSRILLSLMNQKTFDQAYLDLYLKMVASMQSDYEKSRDLLAPMRKYPLTHSQSQQIMDATAAMRNDYEKGRLLTGLTEKGKLDEKQMDDYLKVVDSMTSDYERSRSLGALLERNTLSQDALGKVLDATSRMHAEYEKSRILLTVAHKYRLEGALREKYLSIANSLGEYERNRVLAGIVKRASI